MHLRIYDPTLLAIDLRHRRFGFAVFEGHRHLLDWGVRVYPATGNAKVEMVTRRLTALFKLFSPSAIVLSKERVDAAQTSSQMRVLIEAVRCEAADNAIPIYVLEQSQVKDTFFHLGCNNKDEIASALSRIFPELRWSQPPERALGDPEHARMTVFDAIALGLAYWQHSCARLPPLPERA
jgi:Holliday junction resolvasome RuvABC endonuclease subunit